MFLRESELSSAKSRTTLSTNSGKATKRLGRLAPRLAHMCKFIWIYPNQIVPRDTLGFFRGGNNSTFWGSCPIGTNFDSRLRIHVGMVIGYIQVAPRYPRGHLGGGVRVSPIQTSGEAVKRLDRISPNLSHICWSTWEWIYAKQIALETQGGTWGVFRGQTFKSMGKLSNGWTDCHHIWHISADPSGNGYTPSKLTLEKQGALGGGFRGSTIQKSGEAVRLAPTLVMSADSSGNGHRIHPSCPSIPKEALGGGFRGSQMQKSGEVVKRLHRLPPNLVKSADSSGNGHRLNTIRPSIPHGGFRGLQIQKSW